MYTITDGLYGLVSVIFWVTVLSLPLCTSRNFIPLWRAVVCHAQAAATCCLECQMYQGSVGAGRVENRHRFRHCPKLWICQPGLFPFFKTTTNMQSGGACASLSVVKCLSTFSWMFGPVWTFLSTAPYKAWKRFSTFYEAISCFNVFDLTHERPTVRIYFLYVELWLAH